MKVILKKQPNFRDLGGALTKSGQKVRENMIFRSGSLSKIDPTDFSILKDLAIGQVIDLRTTQEIELIGNGNYPDFMTYTNIVLSAGNIAKALIPIFEKGEFHLIEPNLMDQIYFDLITKFKTELASIYRAIINAEQGIVYHCSHGKDRTGVISALLLDFFEVDRPYIYEDYLKSNEFLKHSTEYQIGMIKANYTKQFGQEVSEEDFAPVKALFYCRVEILEAVFRHIDTEYGSVKHYFQKELGLNEAELEILKSKYLA